MEGRKGVIGATEGATAKVLAMPRRKKGRKDRSRVRGTGHLFLRGRIYHFELNWKDQRFRESLETSDRESALIKLDERVRQIRSGELPRAFEPITLQAFYDAWIVEVQRTCKPRTVEDYESRWQSHLKPVFGSQLAHTITKDEIVKYLADRKAEGAGEITQNRENRILQMIFNYNKKKISANDFPEFPSMHNEEGHVRKGRLSKNDFDALIAKLEKPELFWFKALLTMTFKHGFRKSELLGAKVSYFNPEKSMFTLPAFTTKNSRERVVRLVRNGNIYEMLLQLTKGRSQDEALFHRNGKPVKDYRKFWENLTEGIRGGSGLGGRVTIHDLRRSAITNMSNKQISAKQAGTHLTADVFGRYVNLSDEEQEAVAAKIEGD